MRISDGISYVCSADLLVMLAAVANDLGKDVGRNARLLRRKILQLQASFNAVDNCRKPVLAAIQGYCLGGAIDLISACDMRYAAEDARSEEHTSELQSLMRISYAVFCLKQTTNSTPPMMIQQANTHLHRSPH